ncbi:hypothetical protein RJ641_000796 [Dillenia turbinata]|uniref:Uncharacterized protein n=1 Tax=Dillenia turbinata TaxID=194707 RepID=A0AAN8WIT8_9MAGN
MVRKSRTCKVDLSGCGCESGQPDPPPTSVDGWNWIDGLWLKHVVPDLEINGLVSFLQTWSKYASGQIVTSFRHFHSKKCLTGGFSFLEISFLFPSSTALSAQNSALLIQHPGDFEASTPGVVKKKLLSGFLVVEVWLRLLSVGFD